MRDLPWLTTTKMCESKPPPLILDNSKNKSQSVKIYMGKEVRCNCCMLQKDWRNPTKDRSSSDRWKADKTRQGNLYLPSHSARWDIANVRNHDFQKMRAEERKQLWIYTSWLEANFTGHYNVTPQRLAFFNCIQNSFESVTAFDWRIRSIASKCKFEEMTNPHKEITRDRLCSGVQ